MFVINGVPVAIVEHKNPKDSDAIERGVTQLKRYEKETPELVGAPLLYCLYLDKPMRDHVLLQAIARVNRPYVDTNGVRKRIGLVVDFVGVLRDLRKALRFDSTDVSGVIEDLGLLLASLIDKPAKAEADYLQDEGRGSADERLERIVYGRFLETEPVRHSLKSIKRSKRSGRYSHLRRNSATASRPSGSSPISMPPCGTPLPAAPTIVADLANKTRFMVQESVAQEGLGYLAKTAPFDVRTLEALRGGPGSDEAKVFNLVRDLRAEIEGDPDMEPVLQPLKERAERILEDLENRHTTSLAALDKLAVLAKEKEEAVTATKDSGLSIRAFGVCWTLEEDKALRTVGISTKELAQEAETLFARFPNAMLNADEQRRLRAALYRPLLAVDRDECGRIVETILEILLDTDTDACP